jgi:antitoxin HigA-1
MMIEPIHPGEILFEEFLEPLKLSQNALAKGINVPPRRVNEIVNKKRSVTADTALRLSLFFKTTPDYWLRLQSKYDLEIAKDKVFKKLSSEISSFAA